MKLSIIFFLAICLFFGSCTKDKIEAVDFSVNAVSNIVKVGDAVQFNFTGSPDIIAFYSGEFLSDYDFIAKEKKFKASNVLSFFSTKYSGVNNDCARLKYSTNFNGSYDSVSIAKADWIDITSRFYIPDITPTSVFYDSGEVDITDMVESTNNTIYFGWFFETKENSRRTIFKVNDWQIKAVSKDDTSIVQSKYTHVSSAFKMLLGSGWANETTDIPLVNTTQIVWTGVSANVTSKQGWAITAPLYLPKEINYGIAHSIAVKSLKDGNLSRYTYTYDKPGTYQVTFMAANSGIYGRSEVIRQLTITVEP